MICVEFVRRVVGDSVAIEGVWPSVCALAAAAARLSSIHSTILALAFSLRMVEYRGVSVGVMSVMQGFARGR